LKKITLVVLVTLFSSLAFGQTNMPASGTSSVTVNCAGAPFNFYDSGGSGGNYGNSESGVLTFCTNDPCKVVRINFSALALKNNDVLYIYDGPNTSATLINSYTNTSTSPGIITASGTCITVRFTSNNSQNDLGWTSVVSCVVPSPTVANDLCCGAIALPVNGACSFTASGNTTAATQSIPGCGGGNADDDVWYSFVATGPLAYVTVAPGASYNATVEVFSQTGGCGTLTSMQCVNGSGNGGTENVSLSGLTTGATYYIRVFHNGVGASATANFNICITNTIPCTLGTGVVNIGALPYNSGATTNCGNIDDITAANVTNICGSTLYYGGEDNIYTFTPATSGNVNINVTSAGSWMGVMLYQGCPTSGGTCVNYAQSSAGNQSMGCVSVTAGVTYYLIIDSWPTPTCNPFTLTISAPAGGIPPGTTCGNPVNIVLPYSASGESTSCMGNDYTNASAGSCGTLYESGEDKVYAFTATAGTCYQINITGANSTYIGYQVYQGCPGTAGTTCIANAGGAVAGTLAGSFTVGAAGTYYIIIDSWNPPANVSYNISVSALGGAPANDLPCNAVSLTLGLQQSGDNSCSGGSGEPAAPACWLTPNTINSVWYSVIPTGTTMNVRTNPGSVTNTQIAVYSGACGALTFVNCNDNASACGGAATNGSELMLTGLTAGNTYWIRVDGYGSLTGSFSIICVDGAVGYPPVQGQDCSAPNPVCNQVFGVSNPGYSGYGNNCDLPSSYCLASSERNVAWYTLPMNAAGNLVFDIVPNDFNCSLNSSTDYDFAVFKYEATCDGAADLAYCCTEIFNATASPVACNYSGLGVTGVGPNATGNAPASLSAAVCPMCSSCGGYSPSPNYDGAYEPQIPVVAGDIYIIAVSNFSGSTSGFRIDFRTSPIDYTAGTGTGTVTWSGGSATTPTLWTDVNNWGGCAAPSCLRDAQIAPFLNQPIIATGTTMYARTVTVQAGATLTLQANSVLEICGSFYNYGTLVMHPTSTLRFVGTANQDFAGSLVGSDALGHVEVNKTAGQVTLLNNLDMKGNFTTINATSIFNSNQKYVKLGGNFVNFTGNTTYTTTGTLGTLEFNGAAAQSYNQGTTQLDLNFVKMNHTGPGVTLATNMFIKSATGSLTLTLGKINTGGNRVDVANSAPTCVTTGNTNSYVYGNLWRTVLAAGGSYDFPVGGSVLYERANVNLASGNTYFRLQARFDSWPGSPNTEGGSECSVTYSLPSEDMGYWTISQIGGNGGSYNMTLYCLGATNTAPASAWTVEKAATIAGPWTLNGTCVASTATVVNRNGMNGFSVFAAAQAPTPLPVELNFFNGHSLGEMNELTWSTTAEINNSYFLVEKSPDGINYEDMERVVGAGNSNTPRYYSAIDESPYTTTYYRLKQVDYDDEFVHYGPITITNKNINVLVVKNIYPNPADESFFLDMFSNTPSEAEVFIYDNFGRNIYQKVLQLAGDSKFEILTSTWASGVYVVKVVDNDKQFNYITKIVIQ
jgi:hypothetical protein